MIETIRSATLMWLGACIRNKEDRNRTVKLINSIGNQIESTINSFSAKGGAVKNVPTATEPADESTFK